MSRDDGPSPPDYYGRLGVEPSASVEVIRESYRDKARETHPDQNHDDPEATERFRRIQEAYRVLSDPEERKAYDAARRGRPIPDVLQMTREAPTGCGGYLWRVFAGGAAAVAFFALEALGVWSAGAWTIGLAVGGAALVAGLVTVVVANRFPDEAADVSLRMDDTRLTLWADGRTVLRIPWAKTTGVRVKDEESLLDLRVEPPVVAGLRPVPPVLVNVEQRDGDGIVHLDLADTDVPRPVLISFLKTRDAIPFRPSWTGRDSSSTRPRARDQSR